MQLGPNLATRILNEVKALTTESIIIVDESGTIIASIEEERTGSVHAGAKEVFETKQTLYISPDLAEELQGVKPGINLPIFFQEKVIGVIGLTGIPEEVEPFAEMIRRMTELIIKEANYIEKQEWETRMLETFFYEWIYNDEITASFIERGRLLGIFMNYHYQCILIEVDVNLSAEKLLTVHSVMEEWFFKTYTDTSKAHFIRWGRNRFMIVKGYAKEESNTLLTKQLIQFQTYLENKLNIPISIGVGKSREKHTLSKSYEEAKKALRVAEKNNRIIYYDSLSLDLLLQEVLTDTKLEYVNRIFSKLKDDLDLLDTLRNFLANNQSLKISANELHIHINTLHYRLNLIKKLTQIDPKSTEGIALFYLGFTLLDETTIISG